MASITEKRDASSPCPEPAVLVIGGTGFIGYHIVHELLRSGFRVSILSRQPDRHQSQFPESVRWIRGDLETLDVTTLHTVLQDFDKLVFAAGVDERAEPHGDAWAFFHHANVDSCATLFEAAQDTPITHAVLLSSIFLHVHNQHPELMLAQRHPYIRSRVEQHRVASALAENHCVLTTLQIPWVFGTAPHLPSQWNRLINYVRTATPLMCCRGGVNVLSVQSVAEAACGALRYPERSSAQAIGDLNLEYHTLIELLCRFARRRDCTVRQVNDLLFKELMQAGGLFRRLFQIPAGLDIEYLPELLTRQLYVDHHASQALLRYGTGRAESAIRETALAAPENRYVKGWRRLLNFFGT